LCEIRTRERKEKRFMEASPETPKRKNDCIRRGNSHKETVTRFDWKKYRRGRSTRRVASSSEMSFLSLWGEEKKRWRGTKIWLRETGWKRRIEKKRLKNGKKILPS